MRLTHFSPRFTDYKALFPHSRGLQSALCKFYTSLVNTCGHMVEVYRRSGSSSHVAVCTAPVLIHLRRTAVPQRLSIVRGRVQV